ncbi:DUF664 domain-containing protein [Glutamicibacter sp.]|uniref:mycothiol transferase n=1 Tax=Glutamicibacter sp. TaxID=1931995 RepID=UPI0028BD735C|nr:DUF664 domain-containing protein [Glutamicibacter sp.]
MAALTTSEQILVRMLTVKFDEILGVMTQLPENLLNEKLPVPRSNSPVQILVHCCGMMRRWSSTVNLGIPIARNRDEEFTIELTRGEALAAAHLAREHFVEDLKQTNMQAPPRAIPEGRESEIWLSTCQGVLFHVHEEFCQHLGQLEITRDLLSSTHSATNQGR